MKVRFLPPNVPPRWQTGGSKKFSSIFIFQNFNLYFIHIQELIEFVLKVIVFTVKNGIYYISKKAYTKEAKQKRAKKFLNLKF